MLNLACSNEQKVKVTATPVTASVPPRAAQIDGPLKITKVSGEGTYTQDPAEPNSFFAVSGDNPGTTEYLVEADADLGAGVVTIQDTVILEVSGALAASFGLSGGTPEPK